MFARGVLRKTSAEPNGIKYEMAIDDKIALLQEKGKVAASVSCAQKRPPENPDEHIERVKALHPARKEVVIDVERLPSYERGVQVESNVATILNNDILMKLFNKVNMNASTGYDSISFKFLKELCDVPDLGEGFANELRVLLNNVLRGKIVEALRVSQLTLLGSNVDGAVKLRPINVLPAIIRLASAFICPKLGLIASNLDKYQKAFDKGGVEICAITERSFISMPGKIMILSDWKNAFNSISNTLMLSLIRKVSPDFVMYLESLYSGALPIVSAIGETIFELNEGGAQGEPCMPALFCMGNKKFMTCMLFFI